MPADHSLRLQARYPGSTVHTVSADVAQYEPLRSAIHAHEQEHGHVDVLVCNAGFSTPGLFVEQEMAIVEKTMQVRTALQSAMVPCIWIHLLQALIS